jgi:radical SAM protein with 4Fe4S-binding SPASM domain
MLCVNPVLPLGRAAVSRANGNLSAQTFVGYYRDMLDYTFTYLRQGKPIVDRFLWIALTKITGTSDTRFADFRRPCGAIHGQLAYDINGDVYPCDEARGFPEFKLGNVATETYKEIVASEIARKFVAASRHVQPECVACAYLPFCGLCPILSYSEGRGLVPIPSADFRCIFSAFLLDYLFEKVIRSPDELSTILKYRMVRDAYDSATGHQKGIV